MINPSQDRYAFVHLINFIDFLDALASLVIKLAVSNTSHTFWSVGE